MRLFFFLFFLTGFVSAQVRDLWEKPVIIGASLSDGFHLREYGIPFFSPRSKALGLHHHLRNRLGPVSGPIENLGNNWTFMAVESHGRYQARAAARMKPTIVVAVDYLFWYLYADPKLRGPGLAKLSRMEFFEKGLAHLEQLKCPVIIGDIPDAASSVNRVLSKEQYPGSELIKKANKRLEEWLSNRPLAIKIPLKTFHHQASENLELAVDGRATPAGKSRRKFLQWDRIHPTPAGADAVAAIITKSVKEARLK